MRDIVYSVRPIKRHDGKTCWGAYENDHLVDTFISEQRAWTFINNYRRVMR